MPYQLSGVRESPGCEGGQPGLAGYVDPTPGNTNLGVGPDTESTLLIAAGDNPHRLTNERVFASPCGSSPAA